MSTIGQTGSVSNKARWTGYILSGIVIVFLLFDGAIKLIPLDIVIETSEQLGIPGYFARTLGVLTLVSRSSTRSRRPPFSARSSSPLISAARSGRICGSAALVFSHLLFGVYLGLMIWGGLYLRDERLRALIPLRR